MNVTQGGLPFGGSQFAEIGEDMLLSYLKAGWRVAYNLQNGKIIVQKD